jgi:membrane associated rhomboid family serine protease
LPANPIKFAFKFTYMANYRQTGFPALPTVIKYLIIINVGVWLLELVLHQAWFFDFFALHDIRSSLFKPHQLITHLFLHEDRDSRGQIVFAHILLNMFALWMFGSTLENYWGPKRFLNFYMICGVGAGVIYLIALYFMNKGEMSAFAEFLAHPSQELLNEITNHYDLQPIGYDGSNRMEIYTVLRNSVVNDPILGASGAIFGVLVAFGYTFPNTEMFIIPIPFPVKAKYLVGGYVLIELFTGFQNRSGDNVAHFAHLGGALVGFLMVLFWNRTNRRNFY